MLLDKEVRNERENRKVVAGRKTTKTTMIVVSMVPTLELFLCSFCPPNRTEPIYIAGSKEHFPSPKTYNLGIGKADRL